MINLLPTNKKAEIRAARTNLILVRYIAILLLAIGFIVTAMYVTYSVLAMTKTSSDEVIASSDVKANVYSATNDQVEALSGQLSEAKLLLDQEVRYSKVLVNVAQIMPANTIFDKLVFDSTTVTTTPISTKVYAKTSADAVNLRQNFEKSPFVSGVNFLTINQSGSEIEGYPVTADISFTLTKLGTQ
jgi:hypothetical protein